MDTPRRILIAHPSGADRIALAEKIGTIIASAEFSLAQDGVEAMFKMSNAEHQIAFLAEDLPKRTGLQLADFILNDKRHDGTAIILLGEVPENELYVDEVVTGRAQFLDDLKDNLKVERCISRAFNFVSHGDKSEFHLRFLASGEVLMLEGDKADNVYLVKKGRLKAKRNIDGTDHVLGFVELGEFVGEMAYINGEPRSADVLAESACELIEIPVASIDHVLFQKPAWTKALMKTLSKRLKSANNTISR